MRNDCRNAKFNFQGTFSLSSLLKLLIIRSVDNAKFSLLFQRRSTTLSLEITSFFVKILWQVCCANGHYSKARLRRCCFSSLPWVIVDTSATTWKTTWSTQIHQVEEIDQPSTVVTVWISEHFINYCNIKSWQQTMFWI